MGRAYVAVEGHGEKQAAPNLLTRLWADMGLPPLSWAPPIRSGKLHVDEGMVRVCEQVRARSDAEAMLILRDEDDQCPAKVAPAASSRLAQLDLPFPVAVVLACREYESLFLASIDSIAGRELPGPGGHTRPGIRAGEAFLGIPEQKRDVKGALSALMPSGIVYKPSLDQLPMTRLVDFDLVRRRSLPWFGTLERALTFLASNRGRGPGLVHPPPAFR